MPLSGPCLIQGDDVPDDVLGELQSSQYHGDNSLALRRRLRDDGYLFLRGALDVHDVLTAREEVFQRLAEVGEIKSPASDGIATGTSQRREAIEDLGGFWQSVSQGPALRQVSHGPQTRVLMSSLLGETARPHDFMFLRPSVVGRATNLHYDHPFFARGSNRIYTVWTALGEIPVRDGPLVIVEGSHRFDDLIDVILKIDYESNDSPIVAFTSSAIELVRERRTRLLTADIQAGDVIVFSMTTMHGTLDNHSPLGRARLSCDVRWQPESDPIDPRYTGPHPAGTTGAGYGELNGAKPLNELWHVR